MDGKDVLLQAIRDAFEHADGTWVTRNKFLQESGRKAADVFRHFATWTEAVAAAGVDLQPLNRKLSIDELFADWGEVVRKLRSIPTRKRYRLEGSFAPGVFESRFGPWSDIPKQFRDWAVKKPEWADVIALLPLESARGVSATANRESNLSTTTQPVPLRKHRRLGDRPTYGDPIDFRGLRHAPVNENGVIFLFGMVARELGYYVEAIQVGFPDCEAKRQVVPGKWQRVRIEFEFESHSFVEHGHDPAGCDVLVCWNHNWPDAPAELDILELRTVLTSLSKLEE